jgi:hypothetical protein
MPFADPMVVAGLALRRGAAAARDTALHRLVYRSRATRPLAGRPLAAMLNSARRRNQRLGITGLLIAEDGRYLQWLEGPADGLAALMRSIVLDDRHEGVEVLTDVPARARAFRGWDMRLGSGHAASEGDPPAFELPAPLFDSLWHGAPLHPELMGTLGTLPASSRPRSGAADPLSGRTPRPRPAPAAELDRLIRSLLADDAQATEAADAAARFVALIEPAARRLGDLWLADDLDDASVTIAVGRLQLLARAWSRSQPPAAPHGAPRVLVAALAGEDHALGAVLDLEVLWSAGWMPAFDLPATDTALEQRLGRESFDVLDLSLSPVFERRDRLAGLRRRLTGFRLASRNPFLCIRLGGRIFPEGGILAGLVGADAVDNSCHGLEPRLLRLLDRPAG